MSSIKLNDQSQNIINLNAKMPSAGLDPTNLTTTVEGGLQSGDASATKPRAKPVNLFDTSSFQNSTSSVSMGDGSTMQLPSLSDEQLNQAQNLFSQVPEEHRDAVNAAANQLGTALFNFISQPRAAQSTATTGDASSPSAGAALSGIGSGSVKLASPAGQPAVTASQAAPDVAGLTSATTGAASTIQNATNFNYDSTVVSTAYAGVLGLQGQLNDYAGYMQNTTNTQNSLRTDASELNDAIANWPSGQATQSFTWHSVDSSGNLVTNSGDLTQDQAKAALDDVNNGLSSVGDDLQIQQIQLQSMSQNYQQGIETMSNIMKMNYDTVKNTIGNIHY